MISPTLFSFLWPYNIFKEGQEVLQTVQLESIVTMCQQKYGVCREKILLWEQRLVL